MADLFAWLRARDPHDYGNAAVAIGAAIVGAWNLIFGNPYTGVYACFFAVAVAQCIRKDRQIRELRTHCASKGNGRDT